VVAGIKSEDGTTNNTEMKKRKEKKRKGRRISLATTGKKFANFLDSSTTRIVR